MVVQVWDTEKIVIIPDHYIFTADPRANRNVDILRDFVEEQGIKYFYDITDRSNFKVTPSPPLHSRLLHKRTSGTPYVSSRKSAIAPVLKRPANLLSKRA